MDNKTAPNRKGVVEAYMLDAMRGASAAMDGFNSIGPGYELRAIETIFLNPSQPRKSFDPDEERMLKESVKKSGIIQPILIRLEGEKAYIVAGERRYRAAQAAGLKKVPTIITSGEPLAVALIENLIRSDLSPLDAAEGIQSLMDKRGLSVRKLSEELPLGPQTIFRLLSLNKLPDLIKDMLRSDKSLPKMLAYSLAQLESEDAMRRAIEDYRAEGKLPGKKKNKTPGRRADVDVSAKIAKMSAALGKIQPGKLSEVGRKAVRLELEKLRERIDAVLKGI